MKLKHYECDACQSVFDIHSNPEDNPLEISYCVFCATPLDKDETYEVEE